MNPLVKQFRLYGSLSNEAEKAVASRTKHFSKKKNDHFLKEGQNLSSYFVMSKGLIRVYFSKNGKEMNSWFGMEDKIFGSILPLYTERPSCENIQFMEDAEVWSISADDLNELYLLYPELNFVGRKIAEEVCVALEERITSLHTNSALERYQELIKLHPDVLNRISLGHIASYLGITQETLSRIRKL